MAAQIKQTLLGERRRTQAITDLLSSLTKSYCGGSKIQYQVGYKPLQDPCTATTTNAHHDAITAVSLADALVELQALTERLRRECPWDREQTARTIVPYTVEEAYEVADAAFAGDDAKLLDEIGDLLYQCVLPLAAPRRSAAAATSKLLRAALHAKLVRAASARVRRRRGQDRRSVSRSAGSASSATTRDARASSTTSPKGCPRCSYAQKVQVRARPSASSIRTSPARSPTSTTSCASCAPSCRRSTRRTSRQPDERVASELGDVLFAAVNVARRLNVDPELELRAAAQRFRARVESAEELAARGREDWTKLSLADQDAYYDQAKELA